MKMDIIKTIRNENGEVSRVLLKIEQWKMSYYLDENGRVKPGMVINTASANLDDLEVPLYVSNIALIHASAELMQRRGRRPPKTGAGDEKG